MRPVATKQTGSRLAVGASIALLLLGGFATPALASTQVDVVFLNTGAEQQFTVPDGVTTIHVALVGGAGGSGGGGTGGHGAAVNGDLAVTPGTVLYVDVAGNGRYIVGGFNGGGHSFEWGGGGGASDIRSVPRSDAGSLDTRLAVAAGGGAGGSYGAGGNAGTDGATNGTGSAIGGRAGTATSGGSGGGGCNGFLCGTGIDGGDGSLGQGGVVNSGDGGGGGGGLFGGGAGGSNSTGGAGGGGGSSLVPAGGTLGIDSTGTPKVEISYTAPTVTSFNVAGAASTGSASMTVTYDATPDATQAETLANYSVPGLTLSGTPVLVANTVTITTSTQAAQTYTVTVSNVTSASDATPLTTMTADFTGTAPAAPPQANVSPPSLSFGNVRVGTPSTSQLVTVSAAPGTSDLHIGQLAMIGTNNTDFGVGVDGCSNTTLAAGTSCTALVTFVPQARGSRTATLQVPDDAADSPQTVSLAGTGVAPVATITPSSLDFGTVEVGTTSAHRTITVTNTGDAGQDLMITAETLTPANSGFAIVTEHCATAGPIAAGTSCTIELTFTPPAAGARSAALSLTDNAAGSPHTVSVTGTGGTPSADLAVSISASPNPVKTGQKVTYTITLLNAGPSTASTILINDTLSSQSTFVSATITGGTCVTPKPGSSGVVSCSLSSLASGATKPIQIVVTVIAKKTSMTNTVTVSAATADPNVANNTASITTRLK
jgi:uncharacterized repeat protein (TIGR01451 family)